ncbi:MAG: Spy/CpxP family protein refolding chaperone [Cyanobacteria bacterium SZAS LIN-2]|nr:Spy/CpxP family protein refolding chaperone [Cyanobacteria bacterium SZAS LIN-3]MBS1996451.1 Spy/CpxP family protein refolding chaperone [Cyanobacteria bacterium SZAS LIN-2]MBS2006959.1 Spy/CpxP family protein refolding chaperone [Cyanobacteria bacterium SZAS TMP-1]
MFGKAECGAPGGFGGGAFGKHGGRGGHGPMAMLHGLDLTDEQVLKLAEIKGGAFFKMAHNKIDIMQLKKQVFKELLSPQVDKAKVRELASQIKEKKSHCMEEMLENVIACSEILTPEQKKQLKVQKVRCFLGLGDHEEEGDDE